MADEGCDPDSTVTSTDYHVYKVWFSRPDDFPDRVVLAVVASRHPTQDHGTLYYIVNEKGNFRRNIHTNRAFQLEGNVVRKTHVFGMGTIEYQILQQTCKSVSMPYDNAAGPEDWVDRVIYKYQNEIAFQRMWKSFQRADTSRGKD